MILLTCPAKNIEQQDQGHELVQQDHDASLACTFLHMFQTLNQ